MRNCKWCEGMFGQCTFLPNRPDWWLRSLSCSSSLHSISSEQSWWQQLYGLDWKQNSLFHFVFCFSQALFCHRKFQNSRFQTAPAGGIHVCWSHGSVLCSFVHLCINFSVTAHRFGLQAFHWKEKNNFDSQKKTHTHTQFFQNTPEMLEFRGYQCNETTETTTNTTHRRIPCSDSVGLSARPSFSNWLDSADLALVRCKFPAYWSEPK